MRAGRPCVRWGSPKTNVDTPGEALQKVDRGRDRAADRPESFGGGLWLTEEHDDDLKEPLPLGTRRQFESRGYEIRTEGAQTYYIVDKAGRIYYDRNYHGVIPGIRNWIRRMTPRRRARMARRKLICWIGYQPYEAITRVFWHFTEANPQFEVIKRDRLTVEVFFPRTRIVIRNHWRTMRAEKFRGPIDTIRRKRSRRGTRFIISLKRPANFLYRFESPFLFVDFEN